MLLEYCNLKNSTNRGIQRSCFSTSKNHLYQLGLLGKVKRRFTKVTKSRTCHLEPSMRCYGRGGGGEKGSEVPCMLRQRVGGDAAMRAPDAAMGAADTATGR